MKKLVLTVTVLAVSAGASFAEPIGAVVQSPNFPDRPNQFGMSANSAGIDYGSTASIVPTQDAGQPMMGASGAQAGDTVRTGSVEAPFVDAAVTE